MATDYQTLLSQVGEYAATGNVTGVALLKLALLQQIEKSSNPMADTSVQGLLSQSVIAGYAASSNAAMADLLELALLNLIAGGSGGGGVGAILSANYGGVAPAVSPTGNALAFDTSNGSFWIWDGSTWTQIIA